MIATTSMETETVVVTATTPMEMETVAMMTATTDDVTIDINLILYNIGGSIYEL